HVPGGHHTAKAEWAKSRSGLGRAPVRMVETFISTGLFILGIRDFTSNVVRSGDDPREDAVGLISPEVRIFPSQRPRPGDPAWDGFWWMNLCCRWGSSRPRIREFIAPFPAWKQGIRWDDPLGWIDGLDDH